MQLSSDDRDKIRTAVSKAQAQTGMRFATVIVPASDRYAHYPQLWGAAFALMVGAILALLMPDLSIRYVVLAEFSAFIAFALIFDWLPLRLLLAPKRVKETHARNLAHREFAARILSQGDHKDGLLLFISLSERYVEILATRDVHAKVGIASWKAVIADFATVARAGRIAAGAIAAIETCAAHLLPTFPNKE